MTELRLLSETGPFTCCLFVCSYGHLGVCLFVAVPLLFLFYLVWPLQIRPDTPDVTRTVTSSGTPSVRSRVERHGSSVENQFRSQF